MYAVRINEKSIKLAKEKSLEMGELHNSIRAGKGNLIGFLGEILLAKEFGCDIVNTYDYDLICKQKFKIDVKTKECTSPPRPYYNCTVADFNTKQKCDIYAFVRIKSDLSMAWLLGWVRKETFYQKAKFFKKGQVDPQSDLRPPFKFRADCYNIKISELNTFKGIK